MSGWNSTFAGGSAAEAGSWINARRATVTEISSLVIRHSRWSEGGGSGLVVRRSADFAHHDEHRAADHDQPDEDEEPEHRPLPADHVRQRDQPAAPTGESDRLARPFLPPNVGELEEPERGEAEAE